MDSLPKIYVEKYRAQTIDFTIPNNYFNVYTS